MEKLNRAARLEQRKALRTEEKNIIDSLKLELNKITDLCGLDTEKMERRIKVALKSKYGRVNGMINLLAAVAKWPAESGDGASVSTHQALIEAELGLDLLLLEDISTYKGYHTFHTDELEVIDGVAPQYELYEDYCSILLESLGFAAISSGIEESEWERQELIAIKKTNNDIIELKEAVAAHKELLAQHTTPVHVERIA